MIEKFRESKVVEAVHYSTYEDIKDLKSLCGSRIKVENNEVYLYNPEFDIDLPINLNEWLVKISHDKFEIMTNSEFCEKYEAIPDLKIDGNQFDYGHIYDWLNNLNTTHPYNDTWTSSTNGYSRSYSGGISVSNNLSSLIDNSPISASNISSLRSDVDDLKTRIDTLSRLAGNSNKNSSNKSD